MSSEPTRLTPEQREVWDVMQVHVPQPSKGQTPEQSINLGILSFLWWCDFDGLGQPNEETIRAEFEAAGVPELCPSRDFWVFLDDNPGYPWILAPGANVERWDVERFGRPTVYRMTSRRGDDAD